MILVVNLLETAISHSVPDSEFIIVEGVALSNEQIVARITEQLRRCKDKNKRIHEVVRSAVLIIDRADNGSITRITRIKKFLHSNDIHKINIATSFDCVGLKGSSPSAQLPF